MAAKTKVEKIKTDFDNATVIVNFKNGVTRQVNVVDFPEDIQSRFATYGMKQKLADGYAGVTTPDEALAGFDSLASQLMGGQWGAERTGGGGQMAKSIVAVHRLVDTDKKFRAAYDKFLNSNGVTMPEEITLQSISESFGQLPDDAKKQLRGSKTVKLEMARIDAENAEKADEAEDIFA